MKLSAKILIWAGKVWFSIVPKNKQPENPKKILLLTLPGIGDMLMITPAIRGLRRKYPQSQIDAQTYPSTYPILKDNPHLDHVFIGKKDFKTWLRIRKEHYDIAICYSLLTIPLFAYICGIPYRRGNGDENNGFALTEHFTPNPGENNITFTNRLTGVVSSYTTEWYIPDYTNKPAYPLVIVPDAGTNSIAKKKQWPAEYWIDLINMINKPVTLLGSDTELSKKITTQVAVPLIDWTGKTSIEEFGTIIKKAKMVICNDSAAMHIAATFNVPCFAIFGPTDYKFLTPRGVIPIAVKLHCRPCFYNDSIISECKTQTCLRLITPTKLLSVITPKLNAISLNT
jgi:ADP-heptose:LPS heptosyltransferase